MERVSSFAENKAEIKDAAYSLFEFGLGAYRRNDASVAKILLGMAGTLWEEADDSQSAEKARSWAQAVK